MEPIRKISLIVNLAEHTVSSSVSPGDQIVAPIINDDPVAISFGREDSSLAIAGTIDRVTGKTSLLVENRVKGKTMIETDYDLVCKVTDRLF